MSDVEEVEGDDTPDVVLGSWRDVPPVWLPEALEPTVKGVSQTFMGRFNLCRRSAYLYAIHKGGAASHAMERGSGVHAAIERGRRLAIENGETYLPPDLAKVIVDEVLADPGFAIPIEEHDFMREQLYRWAGETVIDADRVVAIERLFVLDLGYGIQLRAKLDYAEVTPDGGWFHVEDYKSSKAAETQEEVTRTRPDGTRMLKAFQLVVYAVMLAFGLPVDVETCTSCYGSGKAAGADTSFPCDVCGGRGRVEHPAPFPIGAGARGVSAEFVYPAIPVGEEKAMLRRGGDLTQLELQQYLTSLQAMAKVLSETVQTGDWRPVPGTHCATCAARPECPLPEHLKSFEGVPINSFEDAVRAATTWYLNDARNKALKAEIKSWSKGQGGVLVPYGRDRELAWVPASKTTTDREGLVRAAIEAAEFGLSFEPSDFVKPSSYTEFKDRKREVSEDGGA